MGRSLDLAVDFGRVGAEGGVDVCRGEERAPERHVVLLAAVSERDDRRGVVRERRQIVKKSRRTR